VPFIAGEEKKQIFIKANKIKINKTYILKYKTWRENIEYLLNTDPRDFFHMYLFSINHYKYTHFPEEITTSALTEPGSG